MLDLIGRLGSFGIDVVLSSHVLRDIERTCDWVVMLDEGTLLHSGPIGSPDGDGAVRVEVNGSPDNLILKLEEAHASVTRVDNRLSVTHATGDVFDLIRDAASTTDTSLRRLDDGASSLEELFLTKGSLR